MVFFFFFQTPFIVVVVLSLNYKWFFSFFSDTKRREPWVFGSPHTERIREAIRRRYALLPYVYTLFRENNRTGMPILRYENVLVYFIC